MVAIFENGRRNIHVLLSQLLIHVEKQCWCLNIHYLGQSNYKYANLIFDHRGSHFFQIGRQNNMCFIKILVSKYTFSGQRITQKATKNTLI